MNRYPTPAWQLALLYLRAAADEARLLGHGYVAPEHLLGTPVAVVRGELAGPAH